MKNLLMKFMLKWRKQAALFEVETDLAFLHAFKSEKLNFDLGKARKRYAELKSKDGREEKEDKEMIKLSEEISECEATRREVEKLNELRRDLEKYIEVI